MNAVVFCSRQNGQEEKNGTEVAASFRNAGLF